MRQEALGLELVVVGCSNKRDPCDPPSSPPEVIWPQVFSAIVLAVGFVVTGPIGCIIAAMALLTHLTLAFRGFKDSVANVTSFLDVINNTFFVIYVNVSSPWQPQTAILTAVAIVLFSVEMTLYLTGTVNPRGFLYALFHLVAVALPLWVCLLVFEGVYGSLH